jgi:hypothetical protein
MGKGHLIRPLVLDPQIVDLTFEDVRTYSDKADLSHRYDIARLVQFKKA